MRTFSGRLWLVQDRYSEVRVQVQLDEERITITSNGTVIGDWPFAEVELKRDTDGIHIFAEDEELVISSREPGFNRAMLRRRPGRRMPEISPEELPGSKAMESPDEDSGSETDDREDSAEETTKRRKRKRRGAHREPWSLKLRW